MYEDPSSWFPDVDLRSRVYAADGYGLKVRVDRAHLVVEDGIAKHRRVRRFTRAMPGIDRLVILGHTGFITLEALRWMRDAGIAVIHVDNDGEVVTTSARVNVDEPGLRRAQALATTATIGMTITRGLLKRKLEGQHRLLVRVGADERPRKEVMSAIDALTTETTLDRLRFVESRAAAAYWSVWESVEFPVAPKDQDRVPGHWLSFGPRTSPLTGQKSFAVTPGNAIRNYLYALAEAEARLACMRVGLDPGVGIMHADKAARDSFALDLLEVVRPTIDGWLLDLVRSQVFSRSNFAETRQGVVRVLAPLTHTLAATCQLWAEVLVPVAEWASAVLVNKRPRGRRSSARRLMTPASTPPKVRARASRSTFAPKLTSSCEACGRALERRGMAYCDDCRADYFRQRIHLSAHAALDVMKAEGADPRSSSDARKAHSEAAKRRRAELAAWKPPGDARSPEDFRSAIFPYLTQVSVRDMVRATGLSAVYCAGIRRGAFVPHERHWAPLQSLINEMARTVSVGSAREKRANGSKSVSEN